MSTRARLSVFSLVACLTICQLALAQGTEPSAESQSDFSTTPIRKRTVVKRKRHAMLGQSHAVAMQTPDGGQAAVDIGTTGQYAALKASGNISSGTSYGGVNSRYESSGFKSSVKVSYGVTDNFYFGAGFGFDSYKSTTSLQASTFGVNSESTERSEGLTEPSLLIGAQGMVGRTRLLGELEGQLPIGERETTKTGTASKSNALEGGGAITPRLGMIADVGPILLLAQASYSMNLQHKSTSDSNGVTTSYTKTGGNTMAIGAGMEVPQWMNFGALVGYGHNEATDSVSNLGVSSRSASQDTIVAMTYMGIPITQQAMLTPRLAYGTTINRPSSDGISYDQYDVWMFGLNARLVF